MSLLLQYGKYFTLKIIWIRDFLLPVQMNGGAIRATKLFHDDWK